MNIIDRLLVIVNTLRILNAYTTVFSHTYIDLLKNINKYSNLLKEYKKNGINKVGIIAKEEANFDTLCLVLALMQNEIVPVIINENIGLQVNGILKKEKINIVFYESYMKPPYLQKYDVSIDSKNGYFATANPYINVKNKNKIKSLKWFLNYLGSDDNISDYVCKLYDKVQNNVVEQIITEDAIIEYNNNFSGCSFMKAQTTLPLYKEQGFLYLLGALFNKMDIIYMSQFNISKNINEILKLKPSTITIDTNMVVELAINPKFKNIDLSFVNKVLIDVDERHSALVFDELQKANFNGEYFETVLNSEVEKQNIINK